MMSNTPSAGETIPRTRKPSQLEQANASSTIGAPPNARAVRKAIERAAPKHDVLGLSWRKMRAARVSRLGESVASIVHEVNQPLAAIRLNGQTALRWLDAGPQNVARARTLIERIVQDAGRTLDMVAQIRAMATGHAPQQTNLTLDEIIVDAMRTPSTRTALKRCCCVSGSGVISFKNNRQSMSTPTGGRQPGGKCHSNAHQYQRDFSKDRSSHQHFGRWARLLHC